MCNFKKNNLIFHFRSLLAVLLLATIPNICNAQCCEAVEVNCDNYKKVIQRLPTFVKGQKHLEDLIRAQMPKLRSAHFEPHITIDINAAGQITGIQGYEHAPMNSEYFIMELFAKKTAKDAGNWTPLFVKTGKSVSCRIGIRLYLLNKALSYEVVCGIDNVNGYCENDIIYKGQLLFE